MEVKASLKYLRIAPRKVRLVANLLKGLSVAQAEAQLKYLDKRSARHLEKLLHSAVANAIHNFSLEKEDLFIANIRVDQGPTLIRYMPRARGAVSQIRKRSSHITLILKSKTEGEKKTVSKKRGAKKSSNIPKTNVQEKAEKGKGEIKDKLRKTLAKEKEKEEKKQKVISKILPKRTIFRRKSI